MKRMLLAAIPFVAHLSVVVQGEPRIAGAAAVSLAAGGRAEQEIVVAAEATEATRATAAVLVDYLQRISGAKFVVRQGDGRAGIAVGLPGDSPGLTLGVEFDPTAADKREDYLLRSH